MDVNERAVEITRKATSLGAVGMGILLAQPVSGLADLGYVAAGVLSVAAIPAYLGKPWGITLLRGLYWLLLISWTLIGTLYYVVGPIGGSARSPGLFLSIVILWCVGGVAGLSIKASR